MRLPVDMGPLERVLFYSTVLLMVALFASVVALS